MIPSAQLRVTFLPYLAHVQRDPPPAAISEGPHAVSVLFAKPRSELGHSLLPLVRHQHALVDHEARLAAVLDIEHGAHVGRAVAREALVGPTKRVGRQDHVVQLQDRIVRIGRLLLQHVEPGAGDAMRLRTSVKAFWSTMGPRAVFMK
jgi:hypothetical protein